ncbi:hypothetical protein EV359DRAFT_40370 [Lentinula novae-zelandiae]|nr:hypothetical protein EV359DRAFT_40370 [Lentinula novae-zelandiae]
MAPVRTEKSNSWRASTSQPRAGQLIRKNTRPLSDTETPVLPGVQKIKSAIRQTKRLLAREKLAADVRVTSERKLKSLEADLAKAELGRKERALSTRYHKIKFFERQKIVRKIIQIKRKLSEADSSNQEVLETELHERRVELNYITHYPKTKKYISLFPPDVRNNLVQTSDSPSIETDRERDEVKKWIRDQMAAGILPTAPEDTQRNAKQTYWGEKFQTKFKAKEVLGEMDDGKDDFFEEDEGEEEEA